MTYFITPVLGLTLATPATAQTFETPVVNNNFILLENGVAADRTRLVSLEARDGSVADLTALLAIATPAQGWTRTVIEGSALFEWNGAWVQITTAIFSSLANRDAAYAKAGGVYKVNGARVFIPGAGFTNGVPQPQEYSTTTSTWRSVIAGRVSVAPNSVAGTGVSIVGNKVVFVNNLTDMNLYGVFTDEFEIYDITISWAAATSVGGSFRLLDAVGTIDTSASYGTVRIYSNSTAAPISDASLSTFGGIIPIAGINGNIRLRVTLVRVAQAAMITFEGTVFSAASAGSAFSGGVRHNVSAIQSGIGFQFSAAATGTVQIEGVRI